MSFKKMVCNAVTAMVFLLSICGLVSVGCDGGGNPSMPPSDKDLVGDWLVNDGNNEKGYIILNSSGELLEGKFQKVGGFWIEGQKAGEARWKTAASRHEFYVISSVWTDTVQYTSPGETFTTTACYTDNNNGRKCYQNTLKRINLDEFRNNLGIVYTNDRNLYTSTKHNDLAWYSQDDESEIIDFDVIYFYNGSNRYINGSNPGLWYTSDSKLFLLNVEFDCDNAADDCKATVLGRIESDYKVTINTKLTIRPVLSGGGSGPEDVWLPTNYDGRGVAKIRNNNGGKCLFSPLARITGR